MRGFDLSLSMDTDTRTEWTQNVVKAVTTLRY